MRNGLFLTLLLFFSIQTFAQEKTNEDVKNNQNGKNEIRLNIAMSIAGFPELTYERFLEDNLGIGFSAGAAIDKPENISLRSGFSPFGRLYFGKKQNAGFFIEANMMVAGLRERYNDYIFDTSGYTTVLVDQSTVNFGLGAAVGVKLLTRNGFVGEIYAGGGRLFGNTIIGAAYPRLGITIGKRF